MPMTKAEEFGTNSDQTQNNDYCVYCFKDGTFTSDLTMDEMIEFNLKFIDEYNKDAEKKITAEEARAQMREFFPMLKRWKR